MKKKRKQKKKFNNRTDRHHPYPKSRKKNNDTVEWDLMFHRRWHELFGNMTVIEIYEFIEVITKPNRKWTSQELARLREKIRCG